MDIEQFKQLLLAEEQQLLERTSEAETSAREGVNNSVHDAGDESVNDVAAEDELKRADISSAQLQQVQDALKRIEDGTFGKCIVDGGPIEEKRLEAIPWTPYCLKHEQQRENADPVATPSL